jgi:hypothetical protein
LGAAGIYYESTPLVIVAMLGAVVTVISWIRITAPHDHWRGLRRRHPSDP